jgi:hypothetical protein
MLIKKVLNPSTPAGGIFFGKSGSDTGGFAGVVVSDTSDLL